MWPQWIQITKLIFFCKAYLFLVKLESLRVCRDGLVFNSQTLPLKASLLPFQTYMVTLKVIQKCNYSSSDKEARRKRQDSYIPKVGP